MVKLILALVFFLISLLTILPAPAYFLWLVAILVDEFPWAGVTLTVLVFALFLKSPAYPVVSNTLFVAAFLLFISPVVRAINVSEVLDADLAEAFGPADMAGTNRGRIDLIQFFGGNSKILPISAHYKSSDSNLKLDFYPSQVKGIRPCVIVVHGGSWKSGDNKQLPELNSILAEAGYHVAAINYRLAPDFQCPAQVGDIKSALDFLRNKSKSWQIDTSKLVLLGRSAGAQISLLAGYTLNDPCIKGVIDFYGPADMVWGYSLPSNPLIMNSRKVMEDYLGGPYQQLPASFENASPLRFVNSKSPPTLLIHGKNDVLVAYEHSRRLNAKLKENGVKHYFLTLPWATHGFDYNINGPGGQLSTYAVIYFLKFVTK